MMEQASTQTRNSKRKWEEVSSDSDEDEGMGMDLTQKRPTNMADSSKDARLPRQAKTSALSRIVRGSVNTFDLEPRMCQLCTAGPQIKFMLDEDAQQPTQGTTGAAGWDLYSTRSIRIEAGGFHVLPTGLRVEIPDRYYGKIEGRSGLARRGLYPIGGVVDSDYRGPLWVILRNSSTTSHVVCRGDRVAQLIILRCVDVDWKRVSQLSTTTRGCQGFGSTGRGFASLALSSDEN